jgi:hypothetical protein
MGVLQTNLFYYTYEKIITYIMIMIELKGSEIPLPSPPYPLPFLRSLPSSLPLSAMLM